MRPLGVAGVSASEFETIVQLDLVALLIRAMLVYLRSYFFICLMFSKSWRPISLKDGLAIAALGLLGYGISSLCGLKIGGVANFGLKILLGIIAGNLLAG